MGERIDDDLVSSGIADLLEKEAVGYAIIVFFSDVGQEFQVLVFVEGLAGSAGCGLRDGMTEGEALHGVAILKIMRRI